MRYSPTNTLYSTAERTAQTGIVRNQASTIFPTSPHLTAENRIVLPTPMIAVEMICVVLMGIPKYVHVKIELAAVVSAAKP